MKNTTAPTTSVYGPVIQQLLDITCACTPGMAEIEVHHRVSNPAMWARDFRTIHVGGKRQSGKTSWIVENCTQETLVVVKDLILVRHLCETSERAVSEGRAKHLIVPQQVTTARTIATSARMKEGVTPKTPRYSTFVVDEASFVFEHLDRKAFYKWAMDRVRDDRTPIFILFN